MAPAGLEADGWVETAIDETGRRRGQTPLRGTGQSDVATIALHRTPGFALQRETDIIALVRADHTLSRSSSASTAPA